MKKTAFASLALLGGLATGVALALPTPGGAEHEAVQRAVLDYVEGIYEVKPELIERSVHPDLVKYGFWRESPEAAFQGFAMTKAQLVELAAGWNEDGQRANADSPKEIVLLDVLDQTASAKLTAAWGVDYFHLAKFDGKWQIAQVLWQSPPAAMREHGEHGEHDGHDHGAHGGDERGRARGHE